MKPLFDSHAQATLERVSSTFGTRGTEYGDTWRDCQWLTMKAVARRLGVSIPPETLRAIACAVLVDVKHQRMQGGYKDDNLIDGIAYSAVLAEEMEELCRPLLESGENSSPLVAPTGR